MKAPKKQTLIQRIKVLERIVEHLWVKMKENEPKGIKSAVKDD